MLPLWLGSVLPVMAARYTFPLDARSASLGGAYSSVRGDAYSTFYNPASLYFLRGWATALSASNPFSEADIIASSATVAAGFDFSAFAFSYDGLIADPLFEEWTLSWSHGFPVVPKWLSLGWGIKYSQTQLGHESPSIQEVFDVDVGANLQIRNIINIGLAGNDLTLYHNEAAATSLPNIRAGISTTALKNFLFALEISYEGEGSLSLHLGQEWAIKEVVFIRAGVATEPLYVSLGLGAKILFTYLDYAFSWHPDLGFTHLVSLQLKFKGKKNKKATTQRGVTAEPSAPGKDGEERKKE